MLTIHVAYAYSRKFGYHARAYATSPQGGKDTLTVGLGDTAQEAIAGAVKRVKDEYARDGLPAPQDVRMFGRVPSILLDNYRF